MSRVEENAEIVDWGENTGTNLMMMAISDPAKANIVIDMVKITTLVDISRSLAVIADSMSYIVEDDKQRKEDKKRTMPDYSHKNGTAKICGFCDKAEYAEAIYHCDLHNYDVAFTCPACSDFSDCSDFSESTLPPDESLGKKEG